MNQNWRLGVQAENAKRMAAYQKAHQAWQSEDDLLRYYAELGRTAGPVTPAAGPRLRRGERVLWTADGVSMVEMPDTISLFAPQPSGFSPTRNAGAYAELAPGPVRDVGFAAVTNQRVAFMGTKGNRDWDFAQLTGLAHGKWAPMTLMRVGNRQRLSGLVFDGDTAPVFQFFLSLGLAEHQGDRAGLIAHLDFVRALHLQQRPTAPEGARPEQARRSPVWLIPVAAAAVTVTCVGAVFAAAALPDLAPSTPVAAPSPSRSTTAPTPAAAPAASPTPVVVITTLAPPPLPSPKSPPPSPKAPSPKAPSPKAPSPTAPSPKAPSLCGAPSNPWGYNFCGGGKIHNPPSNFCSYFHCIDNLWKSTNGYVAQCNDGMFSHSGGVSGACSHHGGVRRALNPR